MDTEEQFYVSWRGNVTGPFTLEQIETRLRQRSINSLSRVQIGGEWVLLRDALSQLRHKEQEPQPQPQPVADPAPTAILEPARSSKDSPGKEVPERDLPPESAGVAGGLDLSGTAAGFHGEGRRFGITSFILSLFFFVPVLNVVTILLSLVFGHIALRGVLGSAAARERPLPWIGVWSSYIYAGLFLAFVFILQVFEARLGLTSLIRELDNLLGSKAMNWVVYLIHGCVFLLAVFAVFGGGLLILVIRMLEGYWPRFHLCYVGSLLPISIGFLTHLFLNVFFFDLEGGDIDNQTLAFSILAGAFMFIIQIVFWAPLFQSPNGQVLGYGKAALAALFYTIASYAIGFVVGFLVGFVIQTLY